MDCLYKTTYEDKKIWGDSFCGPTKFIHGKETLISRIIKRSPDGQTVEVYCTAMPARFYTIKVLEGEKSVYAYKKQFEFRTGSGYGMQELSKLIANAIAEGMLNLTK